MRNRGITLVSLVVTIVILIILAGISLNANIGENGIFRMAQKAKENMELAQIEEEERLNELYMQLESEEGGDIYTNEIEGGSANQNATMSPIIKVGQKVSLTVENTPTNILTWKSSKEEVAKVTNGIVQGLKEGVTIITGSTTDGSNKTASIQVVVEKSDIEKAKDKGTYFNEKTTIEDGSGNKVVIPKDFKIAKDSGNNVTEGIVIEDGDTQTDGNGEQRGNQYVWIPVGRGIKKADGTEMNIELGRYEFADGTATYKDSTGQTLPKGTEILRQSAANYDREVLIDTNYKEIKDYRKGVAQLKGGLNATALNLLGFVNSVKENGGYYIARYEASYGEDKKPNSKVSKDFIDDTSTAPTTEGTLWNNIKQIDAAQKCGDMYSTVNSDLVNSYAWDTAILYIQKFSGNTTYSQQNSKNTSSIVTLTNTGKAKDEICKINDMAANCCELTTEYSTVYDSYPADYPGVIRGGYSFSGRDCLSKRYFLDMQTYNKCYSFRTILYIK